MTNPGVLESYEQSGSTLGHINRFYSPYLKNRFSSNKDVVSNSGAFLLIYAEGNSEGFLSINNK